MTSLTRCALPLVLALMACAPEPDPLQKASPWIGGQAPAARDFDLAGPSRIELGQASTWRAQRLPPGTTVYLGYGLEGTNPICPALLQGVCLDMTARLAGQGRVAADGTLRISFTPSSTQAPGRYLFQAAFADANGGHTSVPVTVDIVDPNLVDSDGDGLSDARERQLGTDPNDYDTDGDNIDDGDEVNRYGTNPRAKDTDGGGGDDLSEVILGTDPRDPSDDVSLFTDTDGDGIFDCLDTEECDGRDNDGDGDIDEGFDSDGDGKADCLEEKCNCIDDDGDGNLDEGCLYDVTFQAAVDDAWEAFIDGASVGTGAGWNNPETYTVQLAAGVHHAAVYGKDVYGVVAGFLGAVYVDGTPVSVSGDGSWRGAYTDPGPGWQTTTSWAGPLTPVAFTWPITHPMQADGAQWVWAGAGVKPFNFPQNWLVSEFKVCGEYAPQEELCDGLDNDGDGDIDENFPDTDGDGIADCVDVEEICDGLDNDGDGKVDDGFPDTDYDGIADCVDVETCDGLDNDGDGTPDDGFPDTDGDGTADCVDPETCDGLDNDGDGTVDEGYDLDGNGVADCFQEEICDCEDNNLNGEVDEGCRYTLDVQMTADDSFEYWLDGAFIDSEANWSQVYSYQHIIPAGVHHVAVHAKDVGRVVAGFIGAAWIDGNVMAVTGDGNWLATAINPGAGWQQSTAGLSAPNPVAFWWGYSPAPEAVGAEWVWPGNGLDPYKYTDAWFVLQLDVCGEYEQIPEEICNGIDDNGDGFVDEGFPDNDNDGIANCVDDELRCNGLDDDGDGLVDEGFIDSDYDGIADCVDQETCDGLDNDGDGYLDEGFPDTDGDGIADCIDKEECDGVDNNGNGQTDEGFPDSDRDGIADCVDEETRCNGLDDDGDGLIDEGWPDTDNDGTADCVDEETCDALDNDGDGQVDENFDADGDGIADCLEAPCETEDGRLWIADALGRLVTWDPATDTTTFVVQMDQGMLDIAWGADGRLYGLTGGKLWTIDLATGATVSVGNLSGNGLVGDAQGRLLASGGGPSIIAFDPATSTTSTVFTANNAFSAGDLTFYGGELYMAGYTASTPYTPALFLADTTLGQWVATVPWTWPAVYGAATDAFGNTWAVSNNTVIQVDIPTGTTTAAGTLVGTNIAFGMSMRGESCQSVTETCNGIDDDGNGQVDEGYPDTDGDGKADCIDVEECFDCLDNDGDGEVDEACENTVQFIGQADDRMSVAFDGNPLGTTSGWQTLGNWTTTAALGTHYITVAAEDVSGVVTGFRGFVAVNGNYYSATGDQGWLASRTAPTNPFDPAQYTAPWSVQGTCGGRWNTNNALDVVGADWIWSGACNQPAQNKRTWFMLPVHICPER